MKDLAFRKIAQAIKMPKFQIWLIEELDSLEDSIYSGTLNKEQLAEAKARHKVLTEVRDKYCELQDKDTLEK